MYTNGLHDELTGLSLLRPNRILLLEINPMGSADAYSALPDVGAVDGTPWGI